MITQLNESFNARNSTPAQVAETFIPSSDYDDLWKNEHTVLLGPRGSGKTTLLKMLTVQALHTWHHPTATRLRSDRPFTAIYVPTDMHWHHQLRYAADKLQSAPRFSIASSQAAVTTSILLAVARTFQDRIQYETPRTLRMEAELCDCLIKAWKLPSILPCLDAVVLSLKKRMSEVGRLVNEVIFRNSDDAAIRDIPDYFHFDYFPLLDVACNAFDNVFKLMNSGKWAICLDELELAPSWLQRLAFSQQRSVDENYLIKLSTSPLPSALGLTEAHPKQDLRLICLWDHANRGGDEFPDTLGKSILSRRLSADIDPMELFGQSSLVSGEKGILKYARGSYEWHLFKDLAEWDTSFNELLRGSGISPADPVTDQISIRDTVLRKAKPVALLRSEFLKRKPSGGLSLRSRKLGTIYCGWEAIKRVSDGNPRRLIGILDACAKLARKNKESYDLLDKNQQANILDQTSRHFLGYVKALPGGTLKVTEQTLDLATLLQTIGTFFRQILMGLEFPLDPKGSFYVDPDTQEGVVELLRLGVYHGALVHVDPVPDSIETDLRSKRFRLSYMLSPHFKLPLTLNQPVSLSAILMASTKRNARQAAPLLVTQNELFPQPNL